MSTLPPPDERISAYLDGELPAEEHFEIQQLLITSAEWRAELDEVSWARVSVRAMPAHLAPAGFWERLRGDGPQEAKAGSKPAKEQREPERQRFRARPVPRDERELEREHEPEGERGPEPVTRAEPVAAEPETRAPVEPGPPLEPRSRESPLPVAPPPRTRHLPPLGPVTAPSTPLELPRRLEPPSGKRGSESAPSEPAITGEPLAPVPQPNEPQGPGAHQRRVRRPPTRHQYHAEAPGASAPTPATPAPPAPPGLDPVPPIAPLPAPGVPQEQTGPRPRAAVLPSRPVPLRPRRTPPRRVSRLAQVAAAVAAVAAIAVAAVVLPNRGSVSPRVPDLADTHSVRSSVSDDPVMQLATMSSVSNLGR